MPDINRPALARESVGQTQITAKLADDKRSVTVAFEWPIPDEAISATLNRFLNTAHEVLSELSDAVAVSPAAAGD